MRSLIIILTLLITITINAQWIKTNLPSYAWSLTTDGESIYAGSISNGIYRSDNNGLSWTQINNGLTQLQVWSIKILGNKLFAGTTNGGIFISTDKGATWVLSNNGISSTAVIKDFAEFNSKIFATTSNAGVYISTNNGKDWTQNNSGISGLVASVFLNTDTDLFVGVMQKVYKYDDANSKWMVSSTGIPNNTVSSLVHMPSNKHLFVSISNSGSAVSKSVDNATSWTVVDNGLPKVPVATLATVGTNLFAGNDYGVYLSTDLGANWSDVSTGMTGASYCTFLTPGKTDLFVIYKGDVWKRPYSGMITSVKQINYEIPSTFELSQNYPNPFNPSTKISFSIPQSSNVTLKVYNTIGEVVSTLINQNLPAGSYSYDFNASNLTSGLYLYTLASNSFTQTKKMILIK